MRERTRILPLLLALVMACSLILVPGQKAAAAEDPAACPTVFVHGYIGWGSYDGLNDLFPYFGTTTGSILDDLNSQGYHCYAASVGPYSSAWDRACELYAQLTGTRTDYGIAHSRKYGHDRYGEDFTGRALIPDFTWDSAHKINLVGHSFGGTTIRMMTDLLYDGAAEEVEAARAEGTAVNPLFEGGHTGMIYSITTVSTPFNGTTFHHATPVALTAWPRIFATAGTGLDSIGLGVYDPMLQQFGIGTAAGENVFTSVDRVIASGFYDHNDSAVADLAVERATDLNRSIEMRPDIYYFAHYGNKTPENSLLGGVTPAIDMIPTLLRISFAMCRYTGTTDSSYPDGYGEYYQDVSVPVIALDEEWQPNDCIVNCISARCPFYLNADGSKVYDAHVDYVEGMTYPKGKWTIFPAHDLDHIGIIGGVFMESRDEVHGLYKQIMEAIGDTAGNSSGSDSGIEPGCPTAQFTDMDHNGWYHLFIDYVVENGLMAGTSATTFSPDATVTRGMLVQTLYAMEGKPASSGTGGFSDVMSDRWYTAAVSWAAANGVASGYEDGTFRPDQAITREQLATMLYAYAGYKGRNGGTMADIASFSDVGDISGYAVNPMRWAVGAGLMEGRGTENGTMLSPKATAMRSELAVVLMNLREKIL